MNWGTPVAGRRTGQGLLCLTDAPTPQAAPRLDRYVIEVLGRHKHAMPREDFLSRLAQNSSTAA
ncbi:hypothetical protein GCM10022630_38130 [Thermobifida alba]